MHSLKNIILEEINRLLEEKENTSLYYRYIYELPFRWKINNFLKKNGYIFHGSKNKFENFDSSKIKGGLRGIYGYGVYFTNDTYKADEYAVGNYYFLNIKDFNILDGDMNYKDFHDLDNLNQKYIDLESKLYYYNEMLDNARNNRDYDRYSNFIEDISLKIQNIKDTHLLDFYDFIKGYNGKTLIDCLQYIWSTTQIKEETISKLLLKLGYDGLKVDNQYVIFNFYKLNKDMVKDNETLISYAYKKISLK